MYFYSDSIANKPVEMLKPNEAQRPQDKDQEQLCIGDVFFHGSYSPYKDEFSELLAKVSTKVLRSELMTHQQRMLARALWEACNYGGRPTPGDLKHMEPERMYCEWVLKIDHEQQWKKTRKHVKLSAITENDQE